MNFYKRHIGDYIKAAGHLNLLEHGVYTRLMDVYYTREEGIPEDKAARLISARTKDELKALENVLTEFFHIVDGFWVQSRCEAEINAASAKGDKNRENGKKGGRPPKAKTEDESKNNPHGSNSGNHVGSKNNLSQTPDTRHQTPDLKTTTKSKTEPRGSRLASDWTAPAEYIEFCKTERPDLDPQFMQDKFRDYWHPKPGKDGLKLDWLGTWRNFIRSERRPQAHAPPGKTEKFDPTAYVNRNKTKAPNERDIELDFRGEPI